jgi:hypothetical protein
MRIFSTVLLASFLTALSASAFAGEPQPETAGRPPMAEVHPTGTVARYIVGPAGHVRGFMLRDGTVVFTGRGGDKMAADVAVGQTVRVDGRAAPNASNVVMRAKVYGPHGEVSEPGAGAGGGRQQWKTLDPEQRKERRQARRQKHMEELAKLPATSLDGTVQTILTGRQGNPRALILSNGGNVVLERSLVRSMGGRPLKVGDVVHASGKGGTYQNGASIEATELTLADGTHFASKPL